MAYNICTAGEDLPTAVLRRRHVAGGVRLARRQSRNWGTVTELATVKAKAPGAVDATPSKGNPLLTAKPPSGAQHRVYRLFVIFFRCECEVMRVLMHSQEPQDNHFWVYREAEPHQLSGSFRNSPWTDSILLNLKRPRFGLILGKIILVLYYRNYICCLFNDPKSITVSAQCKTWTVFAHSNTGIVGLNPTGGMAVCVPLFWVCVVLCVGSGLATGWSLVQGVLQIVYRLRNWKSGPGPNRTVDP
jgi:hypothetical protein